MFIRQFFRSNVVYGVTTLWLLFIGRSNGFSPNPRLVSSISPSIHFLNLFDNTKCKNKNDCNAYIGQCMTCLYQESKQNEQSKWKAEFQGLNISEESNAIDIAVSFLTSDFFSIIIGFIGLMVCLVNRLSSDFDSTETLSGLQSRTDILAVVASGSVLLNGLTQLDVTSALAEQVQLEGKLCETSVSSFILDGGFGSKLEQSLQWSIDSLLNCTPANSAVLLTTTSGNVSTEWMPIAFGGILPTDRYAPVAGKSPILDRFRKRNEEPSETYLPTLQALPGKSEFQYLPRNTQAVLLLPVGDRESSSVLVLGADTAKSFTPRDVAWCLSIARNIPL